MTTIAVTYIDTKKYKVIVSNDWIWDDFSDFTDLFEVVQFRDNNKINYGILDDYLTEGGKLLPAIQAKLRAGKMFTIDYRSYSSADGGIYRLDGVVPTGEVDTSDVNGFIIFHDDYAKGISYDERKQYAIGDLATYTQWANGEVYHVSIEDEAGNEIESCGGFVGDEALESYIADTIPHAIAENVEIIGKYDDGSEYETYLSYTGGQ
jgi:hypothetical protein